MSGDSDFMLKIVTENMDIYQEFLRISFPSIEVIWHTKSIFAMDVVKETH
jgi:Lrp/AsnC family leucine-responsive transcriptional regulator